MAEILSTAVPARASPSCEYCLKADHASENCALAPASEVVYRKFKEKGAKQRKQQYCKLFNFGKDGCPYGASCVFMHVCSKCGMEGHKASACKPSTPTQAPWAGPPNWCFFLLLRSRPLWGVGGTSGLRDFVFFGRVGAWRLLCFASFEGGTRARAWLLF